MISADETRIIGGAGDEASVQKRIDEIEAVIA